MCRGQRWIHNSVQLKKCSCEIFLIRLHQPFSDTLKTLCNPFSFSNFLTIWKEMIYWTTGEKKDLQWCFGKGSKAEMTIKRWRQGRQGWEWVSYPWKSDYSTRVKRRKENLKKRKKRYNIKFYVSLVFSRSPTRKEDYSIREWEGYLK